MPQPLPKERLSKLVRQRGSTPHLHYHEACAIPLASAVGPVTDVETLNHLENCANMLTSGANISITLGS